MSQEITILHQRVQRLERWLRISLLAFGSILLLALWSFTVGNDQATENKIIRARGLTIVDAEGKDRITMERPCLTLQAMERDKAQAQALRLMMLMGTSVLD